MEYWWGYSADPFPFLILELGWVAVPGGTWCGSERCARCRETEDIEGDSDRDIDTINKLDDWSVVEVAIGRLLIWKVVYRLCWFESIAWKLCLGFVS